MRTTARYTALMSLIAWLLVTSASHAAQPTDPDWPCVQRKVPTLSLAQLWSGPAITPNGTWSEDPEVVELVREVSSRRVPLEEATAMIAKASQGFGADARRKLALVAEGLVDHVNTERSQVISGIGRYAARQREMATLLRSEAAAATAYRNDPAADPAELERRMARLTFDSRVYQERVQSLRYVCEVPTQFEQRLFALLKAVSAAMARQ